MPKKPTAGERLQRHFWKKGVGESIKRSKKKGKAKKPACGK